MAAAYQQLRARLDAGRKEKLRKAQLAWIQFRDRQCEFEASAGGGGTIESDFQLSCLITVTQERTRQLREMIGREID
jgi:uncharacterized protein YecT (DUF1311 family)